MAACSFNFHNLMSSKHAFIFIFLIFQTIPFAATLSFTLNNFNPNIGNISFERNATLASNTIQLTSDLAFMGRATYSQHMNLWDDTSKKLTDFTTHFSFVINSQNQTKYADGIVFFLAPVGSKIPRTATKGGSLGLTTDEQLLNSTDNPFVAVEFDVYTNPGWDPVGEHVGIDLSSMKSVTNVSWLGGKSSVLDGFKNEAWITYQSTSRNLTVIFTALSNNRKINQSLSYIVDLKDYLPQNVTFGFSAATGNQSAICSIYSWAFNTSLELHESYLVDQPQSSTNDKGKLIGIVVVGAIAFGVGVLAFAYYKRRKNREDDEDEIIFDDTMEGELERGTGPKKVLYNTLARATKNFAEEQKLGEGSFGVVYRGFLKVLNCDIAVKRLSRTSKQGLKEYASEVRIITRLRHRNLVQLLGWCHEKSDLLLVYEYMPNGSLDSHIFKGKSLLTWPIRQKIAQGLASALLYLHEEWEQCVVHRDIKPSNVMLDSNFITKLGDFGLARLVDHEKGGQTTALAGTMGYMAPECITTGKASKESDVYSFGIVALEIACGRKVIEPNFDDSQMRLLQSVWSLYGTGELLQAADPKLCGDYDEQEMERLMIVGLWCAHPDKTFRPSIRQAIHVLNLEAPLPILPPTMPVATYYAPLNMTIAPLAIAYGQNVWKHRPGETPGNYNTESSSYASIDSTAPSVLFPR
ncbi:L-type lectin-domain containing receptor kinase IX.1-like [Apium graveolens]|uniref:L-type lectin-domain containing receptor kinase IX.1-like n=1 Tax=Apium graveolens TaxID=4045 RepID=UPI003D7BDA86